MRLADKTHKTILIVEGNHEGLVSKTPQGNPHGAAERYGAVLQQLDSQLRLVVTRPHFTSDPAGPVNWPDIDGVVFTGAGVYWSADASEAAPARKVMETAFSHQLPVFGSCYGMQLGVAVLGGRMQANPAGPEIAIARDIQINDEGQSHLLYHHKPHRFDALCMHRDDVLDIGAQLCVLSSNAHCAVQAVAATAPDICFWGVQYHPELHFRDIAGYLERSDIDGFAKTTGAIGLSAPPDLSLAEIIADFRAVDKLGATAPYKERYNLSSGLMRRDIHEIELSNWVASIACQVK